MEWDRPHSGSPELQPMCSVAPGQSISSLIGSLAGRSVVVVGPRSGSLGVSILRVFGSCPGLVGRAEVLLWDLVFLRVPRSRMLGACLGTCYSFRLVRKRGGPLLPAQIF
ncbi:unnamed protein product [Sphagnum jensenii]|uniref:Uncharacterized protein n=1 Tax=Sphagnum jensenii TaxID=128206 RepID=A0ABP1BGB5_9BRYO